MTTWALAQAPVSRARFRVVLLSRPWFLPAMKNNFSAGYQMSQGYTGWKEIRQHPYPSSPLDPSVFEDISEEYNNLTVQPTPAMPRTSNQTLLHFVEKGYYDHAERIRAEMVKIGDEIYPNKVFEDAALYVLKRANPHRVDRVTEFSNWFSLIPPRGLQESRSTTFSRIRLQLFKYNKPTYLPVIMRFGILCASKGYTQVVAPQVISFVVRFAKPSVSNAFLDELEDAVTQYLGIISSNKMRMKAKSFRSLAIRTHCLAGRIDEAVKMLQATRARNITVSRFTYNLLLQKLTNLGHVEEVKGLQSNVNSVLVPFKDHADTVTETTLCNASYDVEELCISTEPPSVNVLARDLFVLRRLITSSTPPTATSLAHFFYAYQSIGRTRGLVLLCRKVFRGTSYSTKLLWLHAEMLLYLHTKRLPLLISTFAKHFYLAGVPEGEVLRVVRMVAEKRRKSRNRIDIHGAIVPWIVMEQKIWPTSWHSALVWQALVLMTTSKRVVERLYYQLMQMARTNKAQAESCFRSGDLSNVPAVASSSAGHRSQFTLTDDGDSLCPPPIQSITQGHFNPFILFYAQRATGPSNPKGRMNAERVTHILNDMLQLGISPSEHTLNTLVTAYARSGDSWRVESILKRMEASLDECEGTKKTQFPPPTIITYTSIIQGFVKSKSLQSALAMEARMSRRLQYEVGLNRKTDQVLSTLRSLQIEFERISEDNRG